MARFSVLGDEAFHTLAPFALVSVRQFLFGAAIIRFRSIESYLPSARFRALAVQDEIRWLKGDMDGQANGRGFE